MGVGVCVCMCVCVCVGVCVGVCMCVWVWVCVGVCVWGGGVCVCVMLQDLILLPEVCEQNTPSNCISETVLPLWVCMGDCVSFYFSLSFLALVFHFKEIFFPSSLRRLLLFRTGTEIVFLFLGNTWLRMLPPTVCIGCWSPADARWKNVKKVADGQQAMMHLLVTIVSRPPDKHKEGRQQAVSHTHSWACC